MDTHTALVAQRDSTDLRGSMLGGRREAPDSRSVLQPALRARDTIHTALHWRPSQARPLSADTPLPGSDVTAGTRPGTVTSTVTVTSSAAPGGNSGLVTSPVTTTSSPAAKPAAPGRNSWPLTLPATTASPAKSVTLDTKRGMVTLPVETPSSFPAKGLAPRAKPEDVSLAAATPDTKLHVSKPASSSESDRGSATWTPTMTSFPVQVVIELTKPGVAVTSPTKTVSLAGTSTAGTSSSSSCLSSPPSSKTSSPKTVTFADEGSEEIAFDSYRPVIWGIRNPRRSSSSTSSPGQVIKSVLKNAGAASPRVPDANRHADAAQVVAKAVAPETPEPTRSRVPSPKPEAQSETADLTQRDSRGLAVEQTMSAVFMSCPPRGPVLSRACVTDTGQVRSSWRSHRNGTVVTSAEPQQTVSAPRADVIETVTENGVGRREEKPVPVAVDRPGITGGLAASRKKPDCGGQCIGRSDSGKDKPQQTVSPLCHGAELSFLNELKSKHKFSLAFDHQNQVAATAIKSLDSLNDQIVQYIFGHAAEHHGNAPPLDLHHDPLAQGQGDGPAASASSSDSSTSNNNNSSNNNNNGTARLGGPLHDTNLQTSIVLIRRLLQDAQAKFRKMVEENKQLAVRIDGSIQSANHEVHALREELAHTNKRLSRISASGEDLVIDDKGGGGGGGGGDGDGGGGSVGVTGEKGGDKMVEKVGGGVGALVECGVLLGVKETDIDSCSSSCGGSSEILDGGGSSGGGVVPGGSSAGDGGAGEERGNVCSAVDGQEKMDANKEEVTSEGSENEACRTSSGGVLLLRGENGLGKGCQMSEDSEEAVDPDGAALIIRRMRDHNARLEAQVQTLCQEVTSLKAGMGEGGAAGQPSYGELKLELIQSRQEVNRAKEALQAMKGDRKRLKSEKVDLLHQMKQLYVTLEDKESELRDFIRNYEQRVQESDESIKQLALEKEESEREKWEIIKKARESAERAMVLRSELDSREVAIREMQEDMAKLKEQLADRGLDDSRDSNNATPTPADDNGHEAEVAGPTTSAANTSTTTAGSSDDHHTPSSASAASTTPDGTGSESGSCYTPDGYLSKDDSLSGGGTPLGTPSFSDRGNESLSSLMKWMALSNESPDGLDGKTGKKKKKSFGSLSRVFGRGRTRRSIALPHNESLFEDGSGLKLSLLTPDNYQEKLQTVEAMTGLHMCQWRAGQVLAWMEITLGMPMYGRACALNIKSGKVLLGLSDSELGTALGITNHIHRRKLRLAIEEFRDPAVIKYPQAPRLDVTWVAHKLLPDLGLPQYSHVFERNLVDGRILNSLCRRDLEKYFDIHRKFHQASILHAVELLRRMDFDREKLMERRSQCEESDSDLVVWTCPRLIHWIRSIDLGEFADNLHESGVHGAMMVLEPSFNSDTLATALAIPPSKSYIRRHLATELDALLRPARAALDTPNNNSKHVDSGGKGHTFTRSYRGQTSDDSSKGRLSFRGSLGRAFGKKIRDDLKLAFDSDSPKWKISAPIPIQHSSLDNVVEIPGDSTAV